MGVVISYAYVFNYCNCMYPSMFLNQCSFSQILLMGIPQIPTPVLLACYWCNMESSNNGLSYHHIILWYSIFVIAVVCGIPSCSNIAMRNMKSRHETPTQRTEIRGPIAIPHIHPKSFSNPNLQNWFARSYFFSNVFEFCTRAHNIARSQM